MLCPKCRIEACLAGSREESRDGRVVLVREFACRNRKCPDWNCVVAVQKDEQ